MSSHILPTANTPVAKATLPPEALALLWRWSPEAVKEALKHTGVPPKLDIQGMMNAAFSIDGPALTAQVFEVAIGNRVRELDDTPLILPVGEVTSVELSGQFLLMLLANRMDLLTERVVNLPTPGADPAQLTIPDLPE